MGRDEDNRADIPSEDLTLLRGILVGSLSRENIGPIDLEVVQPPVAAPRRRRKVTFLETNIFLGDDDDAGATPVDPKQNGKPATVKQGSCSTQQPGTAGSAGGQHHWYADHNSIEGKEGQLDREERLRILREKQNEDRQRKLDELKQQALAAQKFREQKEEERRRRLEELRMRDTDRRHQVEERKRQIWEAERDRREAILRKNQEREARIESKRKNERSSIVFAFGSSTPRMLEPGDTGSSYWASRRATSTTNVMTLSLTTAASPGGPLTRRSSERELDGSGSKKRAASAGGIDRKIHHGLRSGEMTPSRPQSSMSQHSVTSQLSTASASLRSRSATTPRKPRPVSIAVTGITSPADKGLVKSPSVGGVGTDRPPLPKVHSSKKSSNTATSSTNATAAKTEHPKKQSADKAKPTKTSTVNTPKATPVHSPLVESGESTTSSISNEPKSQIETNVETVTTTVTAEGTPKEEEPQKEPPQTQPIEEIIPQKEPVLQEEGTQPPQPKQEIITEQPQETPQQQQQQQPQPPNAANTTSVNQPTQQLENGNTELPDTEMTSSMIAKIRITTEEEAKAALAERRRLAREQAEREAELERQRLEAERLAEEERLRKEEEEQRRMEEEQLRLLEEARVAEELRLKQAIEEAQKREEEERKRKEEELKLKLEKEEAEKKAKEEAEKMRLEMEQRLKKEEEDRQARRKRVEAIMLRTRGKGGMSTTTPTKDGEESEENSPADEARKMTESVTSVSSEHDQFLHSERSHSDANNSMSSMKTSQSTMEQLNNKHNGHHNGSYHTVAQNNVTNSLLVSLGTESVGQILDVPGGKIPQDQPQFIPQFQEKKEPHTVNDLLS
ncbi:uncharacterized protein isoform X44 [Rhodnius prolixus]|uniref:uncharacterized protein isoform X44 n=1 Tax=Rhodnius prolixus TaxID=13249 RepID=UPI003D18C4D0